MQFYEFVLRFRILEVCPVFNERGFFFAGSSFSRKIRDRISPTNHRAEEYGDGDFIPRLRRKLVG